MTAALPTDDELHQLRDYADSAGEAVIALRARQALGTALLCPPLASREEARVLCAGIIEQLRAAARLDDTSPMTAEDWTTIENELRDRRQLVAATEAHVMPRERELVRERVKRMLTAERKAAARRAALVQGRVLP